MGGTKNLCQRIRSAKVSLDNAEQSFKAKQDVRGELDLMLAEAELKNLRQKRSATFLWSRQLFAACCAGLILLGGYGGWWWAVSSGAGKTGRAEATAVTAVKDYQAVEVDQHKKTGLENRGLAQPSEQSAGQEPFATEPRPPAEMQAASEAVAAAKTTAKAEFKSPEPVYIQPPVESRVQAYAKPEAESETTSTPAFRSSTSQTLAVSTDEMRQLVRSGKQKLSSSK